MTAPLFTREKLEELARACGNGSAEWIRVQLDTGGIAAGAEQVHGALVQARDDRGVAIPVLRTGSVGYSFADPVVEIRSAGMPRIHYGRVAPEMAARLVEEHVIGHRLVDDYVIATRQRGLALTAPVTHVLVRDSGETAGKTEFFQFALQE